MYDAIIIGQDLSSLVAALTVSRRGLKTLLVNEGDQEAEYCEEGYTFPVDPIPLSGLGREQTILRLLADLNPLSDQAPQLLLMDPALQVIMPSHRVDLFHDRDRLIADIAREFPKHEQEIRRFYHSVAKNGALIERWISEDFEEKISGFGKLLRRLFRLTAAMAGRSSLNIQGHNGDVCALRSGIEAQIAMFSYLNLSCPPFPISVAYLLSLPMRGVFYPVGGKNSWLAWLRKGFTDAGGELVNGCSIMRIDTKPNITIDMEHEGTSTTISGKRLIVSTQWEKLNLLLFPQKSFHRLVDRLEFNRPQAHPFCLHMGVREEGIPEKIAAYSVVVPDESKPARDQNLLFLQMSMPGDTRSAPEGKRAVTATVYLKDSPLLLDDLALKTTAKTIIDSLDWFLPFLRESIDHINIEKSIAHARLSQEISSKKYHAGRSVIAMNTLSPQTPLSNVFLTGGVMRAGLGLEGEILSGMDVASFVGREI